MATRNPQRIEFGQMLEQLRVRASLHPADVDKAMRWYRGKCRKVETGDRVVSFAEVERLADLYKVEDRATLHLVADAARRRETPARVADFAQGYIPLERQAKLIQYYDAELILALMETEDYARAVLSTGLERVDDLVADRLLRGEILRRPDPPQVQVVLGEAALHRLVGGAEIMARQIRHLLKLAELPNVSIRILPFSVGAHRAMGVGFTILTLPTIKRVYIEGLTDATYIHEHDETAIYSAGFEQLWQLAADDEESATILRRHITTEEHDGGETTLD